MKKIISVLLIITTLFAFSLTCFALMTPEDEEEIRKELVEKACSDFSDLWPETQNINFIARVYYYGLMVGDNTNQWKPDRIMTKAELIVLYYKLFNNVVSYYFDEPDDSIILPFNDVNGTEYYCDALKVMYKNGIIVGNEKREFEPNRLMRAEEATAIFGRIIDFFDRDVDKPGSSNLLYADEISDWALKDCIRLPNIERNGVFDFNKSHPRLFVRRNELAEVSLWFYSLHNPIG